MIKIKLTEQLGKQRMSRRELARLIGVRPNTIEESVPPLMTDKVIQKILSIS